MNSVNKPIRKKDAMQLVTGKPVYTDDIAPDNCLIVKLLRSPHANAIIESIDTSKAMLIDGMEAVFTYMDVDQNSKRFTCAGQTYPEPSPQDRLILDRHVRFKGDVVAILAGKSEQVVARAMKLIKVKYNVLPAVLDFTTAKDNDILVHPEDNWLALCNVGADNKRNLCAHDECGSGDIESVLAGCDVIIDRVYHTKACQQSMMEPFTTFCNIDTYGRLNVISSTQIVFHCRRIIANALGISKSQVRVSKPRIGGGFGAKQTSVSEIYPAFVTWKTKKPSKIVFTRRESQTASSPRHEMQMHVRLGAMKDGTIMGIDLHTLSNTGAYGEHGPTTVGLSGHKSIPLYGKAKAFRFVTDVVYTNHMSAGAYRGYGATQGLFAVESAVNELAQILNINPFDLRKKNIVQVGEVMPAYYNETLTSSALDRCLDRVRQMIDWDNKPRVRQVGEHKVRALGMGMAMQGSGIGGVDVGGATLRLGDDGIYNLSIAAADMGTGCDTILAQIAAEVLECSVDNISVFGADTDASPYDSGSYASSTTYVTGKATELCALKLRDKIIERGAAMLGCDLADVQFDGTAVAAPNGTFVTLKQIATSGMGGQGFLEVTQSHTSKTSPPPFMVGACELEIDLQTGKTDVIEFDVAVDCGTPVNPNLARVQAEGGLLQGIGMALSENIDYDYQGAPRQNSFMQYKIPTRVDIGKINVVFESSYENAGPFGAKSIGEVVINTPLPSIADALSVATGVRFTELPIMPEQVAMKKQFFKNK